MKKIYCVALASAVLAISSIQPVLAATLQVENKTAQPALMTVLYHTNLCKDDRGVKVAPNKTVTLKVGLCTVKTVYASITTRPGFSIACIPHERTGASKYVVTADNDLKNCYVN